MKPRAARALSLAALLAGSPARAQQAPVAPSSEPSATPPAPSSQLPAPSVTPPDDSPAVRALTPRVVRSWVPFGEERRAQTAAYCGAHYGDARAELDPRMIVLHYTCGPTYRSAWHTFANNRPRRGEAPGVCAHYVIDFDGTIHELVPTSLRCRHAAGVNHVAVGIEFVQPCMREGVSAVHHALLDRAPQLDAGLRLVRWLRARHRIPVERVVGHSMVNDDPLYEDRMGRRNDHGDWRSWAVELFRARLTALERTGRVRRRRSRPATVTPPPTPP